MFLACYLWAFHVPQVEKRWCRQFEMDTRVCIMNGAKGTNRSWLKTWFTKLFEKTDITISDLSTRFFKLSQRSLHTKQNHVWKLRLPQFMCLLGPKTQMSIRPNMVNSGKAFLKRLEMVKVKNFYSKLWLETLAPKNFGSNEELINHK